MSSFHVKQAAVVGAGTMGGEIASVIASAGIPVLLKDLDQSFIDIGLQKARSVWQREVKNGKLDEAGLEARLALITGTLSYDAFGSVDYVIEAVPEKIEIKQAVFSDLDASTPGHAILASNTSALSIDEIGSATTRPDQVVGFHFFYPASLSRLIEVIAGDATSPDTVTAAYNFAQTIRKMPMLCEDAPGFVVNRALCASLSEMFKHAEEHGLTHEQLDAAAIAGKVSATGPCALADRLGLDTVLSVMTHLNAELGETFYVPEALQTRVAAGNLGRKTGKGFYDY
ncbi:MAG: 3-hydroxyacyl-CoA dehydrogenase family protein [Thermoleophilaceae bacterium]|nr:3-hydroxyacyl-CoA dehydrogenase family protein [Thermoleophilaceae bacterium]